jgi:uncharacterized delta-60 repeat protein
VIIQPDGKIVTAGSAFNGSNYDFALARYDTDGTLDAAFGSGGKVMTDFGGLFDQATAVALQSDKKIVVAGLTDQGQGNANDLAVARYNTDGSLDTSFGSGGKQVLDLSGDDDVVTAIAIQSDGKILIAGVTGRNGGRDFLLARLNVDGTLDTTGLAPLGWVRTDFAGGADVAKSVAIQGDGKIVLAGYSDQGSNATGADFALARYNTDGSPDATFGAGGKMTSDFGSSDDYIEAISIQPNDGKLVVAGHSSVGPTADFAFARYNTDGRLDATFGSGGRFTADMAGDQDYAYALALQTDGKIVAAGYSAGGNSDFAVMRLTAAGALDAQFGSGGKTKIDFSGGDDEADSVAVQADGKIIIAGWAATATGDDFAVARLTP